LYFLLLHNKKDRPENSGLSLFAFKNPTSPAGNVITDIIIIPSDFLHSYIKITLIVYFLRKYHNKITYTMYFGM